MGGLEWTRLAASIHGAKVAICSFWRHQWPVLGCQSIFFRIGFPITLFSTLFWVMVTVKLIRYHVQSCNGFWQILESILGFWYWYPPGCRCG